MLSPFSVDADFIHDCAANDRAAIVLHQEARCVFAARETEAHRNYRPTEPTAEYSAARARERERNPAKDRPRRDEYAKSISHSMRMMMTTTAAAVNR